MYVYCYIAIQAMRKAHEEQLEKYQKAQQKGANKDIHKLHAQFKYVHTIQW